MDKISEKKRADILKALHSSLGEENASGNPAVRSAYRGTNYNALYPWGRSPEFVVMPKTVEHVQEVVKIANEQNLTILPICCGTMTPFWQADIVMDMMGMDKIVKIDPDNGYVVLEPGVTFNRLCSLLAKEGYTIAHGSFPSNFSVVGNLGILRSFNHNFSSRFADQRLGIEIVLPDGTLLRTGTATFGIDYWSPLCAEVLDLRGLFSSSSQRTPPFGIVTKAALRIWPVMEARGLPIGGFDSYEKAMKFSKAVAKAGIADQSMVWNWVLVGMSESRLRGGKHDVDFLNYRMTADYTKPYKGMHYCYTWTQFRGYKEQVDVNLKLCKRIAEEMGGKVLTDEELQDTIPNLWGIWKLCYVDFSHENTKGSHLWKMGGEGLMDVWFYVGWIDDLVKLEDGYNRRLKEKYHWPTQPYYSRIFESGVGGHLRYMPPTDMADDYQAKKHIKMREEMHAWVLDNYPSIHAPGGLARLKTRSIGMGRALAKIREALDPNHIMYIPGEKRVEVQEMPKAIATSKDSG